MGDEPEVAELWESIAISGKIAAEASNTATIEEKANLSPLEMKSEFLILPKGVS